MKITDKFVLFSKLWRGKNLLGQAWMWVREQLRADLVLAA